MAVRLTLARDARVPGQAAGRLGSLDRALRVLTEAIDALCPVLLVGLFVLCLLLVFATVPWGQNADDLLPALISTQKLTVYFWGQNRFANLLPALTAWIASPMRNAEAQLTLRVAAGLLAPALLCGLFYRRAAHVWRATLAADCLLLWVSGPDLLHETFIVHTPYGTAFACAALALLASRAAATHPPGWRRAACAGFAVAALLAAHLVDYALAAVVLPLLVPLALFRPRPMHQRFLVLNVMAAVLAFLAPMVFAPEYFTSLALTPSPDALLRFAATVWAGTGVTLALGVLLPVALAGAAAYSAGQHTAARGLAGFTAIAGGAALAVMLLAGCSVHVAGNGFNLRYAVPGLLILLSLGGIGCWETLRRCAPTRAIRSSLLVCGATLALLAAHNRLAAIGGATPNIIGHGEAPVAEAVAARVTARALDGVIGDYWHVWPAVFAAEQTRHDLRLDRPAIFGVAERGEARRAAFLARLAAQGALRLGCVDLAAEECVAAVAHVMRLPDARGTGFGAAETLPDGHTLRFITLRGGAASEGLPGTD